jgi:hypothetical protein
VNFTLVTLKVRTVCFEVVKEKAEGAAETMKEKAGVAVETVKEKAE